MFTRNEEKLRQCHFSLTFFFLILNSFIQKQHQLKYYFFHRKFSRMINLNLSQKFTKNDTNSNPFSWALVKLYRYYHNIITMNGWISNLCECHRSYEYKMGGQRNLMVAFSSWRWDSMLLHFQFIGSIVLLHKIQRSFEGKKNSPCTPLHRWVSLQRIFIALTKQKLFTQAQEKLISNICNYFRKVNSNKSECISAKRTANKTNVHKWHT